MPLGRSILKNCRENASCVNCYVTLSISGGKFRLSVCKSMNPLSDAALYRSTSIHHTPDSYTKRELVGARPLHLAYARPFGRLKAPLGLSLLRFAAQTRTCRGGAPPSCLRKTVRSLKSPTGAFIAPLRCANANNALFALHKILHRLA